MPQPGNPQSLNRYAYCLGNPLRYADPSGHFTENKIKGFFGVSMWEEVLALFEEGGSLEGKWGWLEVLRQGQEGDFFYASESASIFQWFGKLEIREDDLLINTYSDYLNMFEVVGRYDFYRISRPKGNSLWTFGTEAHQRYDRFRLDTTWARFDKVDAAVDISGIIGDVAKAAGPVGALLWVGSEGTELFTVGRAWDQLDMACLDLLVRGDLSWGEVAALYGASRPFLEVFADSAVDVGRLHPSTGYLFSASSLILNARQAWYYGP